MPVEIHVDLAPVSMRAYTFPGLAPFTIPTSRLGWLTSDWPGVTLARLAKGLIGAITDSMMVHVVSVVVLATIPSTFSIRGYKDRIVSSMPSSSHSPTLFKEPMCESPSSYSRLPDGVYT